MTSRGRVGPLRDRVRSGAASAAIVNLAWNDHLLSSMMRPGTRRSRPRSPPSSMPARRRVESSPPTRTCCRPSDASSLVSGSTSWCSPCRRSPIQGSPVPSPGPSACPSCGCRSRHVVPTRQMRDTRGGGTLVRRRVVTSDATREEAPDGHPELRAPPGESHSAPAGSKDPTARADRHQDETSTRRRSRPSDGRPARRSCRRTRLRRPSRRVRVQ
jgi:hypothetical protein